jgi:lipopolysaccharide transport system permease protein
MPFPAERRFFDLDPPRRRREPPMLHATDPLTLLRSTRRHASMIFQLSRREVIGRYRGSMFGLAWSFFNPLLLLAVYGFFFTVVFPSRWGQPGMDEDGGFVTALFVGLIIHGLFAECLQRAPRLVTENPSYVKKIIFPLEILPWVSVYAALFHALTSVAILLGLLLVLDGTLHWTIVLLPLVLLPLALFAMAASWVLASLGVYIKDVAQMVGVLSTALMFTSPVFFPLSRLPASWQPYLKLNPLTLPIEQARDVLLWGRVPDFTALGLYAIVALLLAWLGFAWFQKTRRGFIDVL